MCLLIWFQHSDNPNECKWGWRWSYDITFWECLLFSSKISIIHAYIYMVHDDWRHLPVPKHRLFLKVAVFWDDAPCRHWQTFQRRLLPPSSGRVSFFETSVSIYWTTRRNISEESQLSTLPREKLKSHHSFLFVHWPSCRCLILVAVHSCHRLSGLPFLLFPICKQFIFIFHNFSSAIHWIWPCQHNYFISIVSIISGLYSYFCIALFSVDTPADFLRKLISVVYSYLSLKSTSPPMFVWKYC
jgi:hypothetical protein